MKRNEWNEGLNHLEPDVVESYVTKKDTLSQSKKKHAVWIRFGAIAACFAILVGTVLAVPLLRKGEETDDLEETPPVWDPIVFDPIIYSDSVNGSNGNFIQGFSTVVSNTTSAEPIGPFFEFYPYNSNPIIVKARVVKNHADTYQTLGVYSDRKPAEYRLIQMETLQVIRGKNVPQYFLYRMPESCYVDMSEYDSLLLSMNQCGAENFTWKNASQNQIEAFPIPVFTDPSSYPNKGRILAFTDGIFDERLWENDGWRDYYDWENGYHSDELIIQTGETEKQVIKKIRQIMSKFSAEPSVLSLQFTSQEAKDALEYVKPFANGVFVQTCSSYSMNRKLVFTRYVNGFETEETITIDPLHEEVTYSDVRYTEEDLRNLENIGIPLLEKSAQYTASIPTPPHMDTTDKRLSDLNLCAWYVKAEGKLYGVIKTAWKYIPKTGYGDEYYDDSYILYDMAAGTMTEIERNALIEIVGSRNVSSIAQGEGYSIVCC